MTKCDRCGEEVGNLFCAKCRAQIEGKTAKIELGELFPLILWDKDNECYVFGCTVKGCPCNNNGLCATRHKNLPKGLLHEFDGDNIIRQLCG